MEENRAVVVRIIVIYITHELSIWLARERKGPGLARPNVFIVR
jgi:hypothetical protein